ncbi:MAG: PDZ domain-containing protein [Victivallales bacterium]|nr:PDZ domain-containing protein [Victivallales bacterium]
MRIILLLVLVLLAGGNISAETSQVRAKQVLNEVWNEVGHRHFDKKFKEKYQKLYKKFEPVILKSRNDRGLSKEINKLLQALGQSHIVLLPPIATSFSKAMSSIRRNTAPGKRKKKVADLPADIGITLSQSNKQICVVRVRQNSPAAKAGIKIGDVILAINNITLQPEKNLYLGWSIIARGLLSGQPGSKVKIKILNGKNIKRTIILTRQINGEKWFKFGVLPRSYSDFYAKILPGNIGYIQFSAFTTPMLFRFRKAITGKLRNVKALIIDMRGNVGGLLMYPPWLAAWCCPETVPFGKLIIKGTELQPKSFPQKQCFKGPVAVLIDNYSYSCAEIFAAGMQDAEKAKLFGTTTSGKCLPSMFFKLPSGFRLQTVTGNIIRANGKGIERIGVSPDKKLILSIKSLRKGNDNVIEVARNYLLKQ